MHLQLSTAAAVVLASGQRHSLAALDAALLAWLALQGPTPRARLAALLWPDAQAETARNTLRQRLFQLRRQVEGDLLEGQAVLRLCPGVTHDLQHDAQLLLEGQPPVGAEFDAWLEQERAVQRQSLRRKLLQCCDTAEAAGSYADALDHALRLLQAEPLSEDVHRRVIRLHYLGGDRAQALLAFDRCERMLKDEVGARPSPETLALLSTIDNAGVVSLHSGRTRQLPVVLLRPPSLVGREPEFETLVRALSERRAVLLLGEAGMGKSRLLAEVVAWQQSQQGARPLLVMRARPGDAAQAYATLGRCLRLVLQHTSRGLSREMRQELARVLPELGPSPSRSHDPQRQHLVRAVVTLLAQARRDLSGLWLDDLHFADDASVELLRSVLAEGAEHGMVIGLASRPIKAGTTSDTVRDALLQDDSVQRVVLAPLTEPQVQRLVESLAQPDLDAATLTPDLMRLTGGNPMFVLELLKHAWESGGGVPRRSVSNLRPANVGQIIAQRLERLSSEALALARLAALAGADFDIELAEALLRTPALRLADAWNELESAQVLRGAQFAHDLVHETVLQSIPPVIARHSHQSLAQWLHEREAAPERVAEHWAAAGDIARSAAPLLEAGRRSLARAFLPQARAYLERAVHAAAHTGQRALEMDALQELHHAYTLDDPGAAHEALVDRLQWLAGNALETLRAQAARYNLARRRLLALDVDEVRSALEQALPLGDAPLVIMLAQVLLSEHLRRGAPELALQVYEQYEAWFDRDDDPMAQSDRLGNLSVILANQDRFAQADVHALRAMDLAREAALWNELMILMANRLRVLRAQGRSAGLAWIEQTDAQHHEHHANLRSWAQSRVAASELLRDAGQYELALNTLAQEQQKARVYGGALAPNWDVAEALLWLHMGQHARALAVVRRVGPDELAASPPWLQARWCLLQAQVSARVAGQGLSDAPDAAARELLNQAAQIAPRHVRRAVWFDVALQRAQWADAHDAMALAEGIAEAAMAQTMVGYAYRAWWLACERALDAGSLAGAERCAAQALALQPYTFDAAQGPEEVLPTGASPTWVLVVRARLHQAQGGPKQALGTARSQIQALARTHVPSEFREGFMQRVPAHAWLGALKP